MIRYICFLMLMLTISAGLYAQRTLTGIVVDAENGEPLPGATIVVDGTTRGTSTDFEGKFSIELGENEMFLMVSFVGYDKKRVNVGKQATIRIELNRESTVLQDVIVTAIGIKAEKKALGYAAQDVKGDELSTTNQSNIVNALSSKIAGISVTSSSGTPGASADIVIRGRSSLRADGNSPLFVVDGVPIDNDYAGSAVYDYSNRAIDLNSDDIESVSVLKGAAASALYGIRAANGAIIITTKSGKGKGIRRNITFKSTLGFDRVNKLPEKQYRYAQGTNGSYSSTTNFSWGPLIDTLRYDGDINYPYDKNGRIVGMSDPSATDKRVIPYKNIDDFFETAVNSNTYHSISGGSDNGSYLFSMGYLNQNGVVPLTSFERLNFKLSGDTKLSDKLKISGSATYSNSQGSYAQKGSNLSAVMVGLMRCTPTFDLTNGSSDPVNDPSAYMFPDGTQRNYYSKYDNPYWSVNKNRSSDEVNRIIGNSQIDYQILPWLSAMYRAGIDFYSEQRNSFFDNNSNDVTNGYVTASLYNFNSFNSDFILTAEKDITNDLKLNVLLGHNYYNKYTYLNSQRGDSLILPNFYDLSNTAVVTGDDYITRYRIVGAYYDIRLSYKNYLYLNTTGRNDWSSTLAKGKNSFFYPAVNGSFIFTEAFNLKNKIFSFGKVRASWAQVGNDAPIYSLQNYYSAISGGINGQTAFATQRTIGNNNLKPEETRSWEVGVDLKFLDNRLGLDMAYYSSTTDGQIVEVPVPYSSGYDRMVLNAGIITNRGVEAQLYATPLKMDKFTWDMQVNFTRNRNIVEDLPEGIPLLEFQNTGLSSTRSVAIKGEPYGVLYGTRYLRNDKGQILVSDDGYPLVDPVPGIVGNPNPDFTLGIRNTFTYKGINLTALVDIKKGGDVYNGTKNVMSYLGTHKETENRDELYVFPGVNVNTGEPNTVAVKRNFDYYSRLGTMAGLSEAGVEDGSYIRLREIAINYSLPTKWLNRTPIKGLMVGVSGRNLLLFTKYSGIDPETNLSGTSNSLGRDYFNMPNTKGVEFNIQVNF
ncbi:SusC/RagA family TonB-linked outer membrane protein [Tenuifilum osseticum]|uniref:SusC/RagA family TonB-linked outer membrane protein n=1 Tax=Tenuifilum osseticum TaxID=3374723 RepID=UPI0034E4EDD5